jgi:hypothetical protein
MVDRTKVFVKDVKKAMSFEHDDLLYGNKLLMLFTKEYIQDMAGK